MSDVHEAHGDALKSQSTALNSAATQGYNLWNAYLGTFWENAIIEGRSVKQWLVHFSVVPRDEDSLPLDQIAPEQVNIYITLLIRRSQEAYFLYNKIRIAVDALEAQLDQEIEQLVKSKIETHRAAGTARLPGRETLVMTSKAELADKFTALRRGKVEQAFFETIIRALDGVSQKMMSINTANAHEIRMIN